MQCQCEHITARPDTGIKREVDRAVAKDTRHTTSGQAVIADKSPADDDLAIGLNGDRVHVTIRAVSGIESQVNRSVAVKTSQIEALDQINLGELPANNDATIFLQGERQWRVVDASAESE